MRPPAVAFVLGGLLAACMAAPALAAPTASAPPQAAAPTPAEILAHAAQDERFIDQVRRQLARPGPVPALLAELAALEAPVEEKLRAFRADELAGLPIARLESLHRHWQFDAGRFAAWQAEAERQLLPFNRAAADAARRHAAWAATRAALGAEPQPAALQGRAEALLAALAALRHDLAVPLARQVELSQRASALATQIETGRAEAEDAIALLDRRLLAVDAAPLWGPPDLPGAAPGTVTLLRGLQIEAHFARDYLGATPLHRRAVVGLQLALLAALLAAHRRARAWPADRRADARGLQRPVSAWLLLSMMCVLVLEPAAPLLAHQLALTGALVPVLPLLPARRSAALHHGPPLAIGLYLLNLGGALPSAAGTGLRLFHVAVTVLAGGAALWLMSRAAPAGAPVSRAARLTRAGAGVAALLLAAALLLNLAGNVSGADMLLNGVLESACFGLLLHASVSVLQDLLRAFLAPPGRQPASLLERHARQLARLLSSALTTAAAIGGGAYALSAFRVLRPVRAGLAAGLAHHFEVGELAVSLGDVLAFAVSALVAWWVARLVRQVLGEQLAARPTLPRGVASSVASLSYCALLVLGFLVALSAAGFKVSQLALVFGALGVGIGFGLQGIVNNFVSGLVLMVERPLRPGDAVEVGAVAGRVQAIGLRATVIRTFDGAEVIVPNGTLISSSLLNWTLGDASRRIEVDVGVAYGSDPAQVLALLQAAAHGAPGLAAHPPPSAFMKRLGEHSMEFVLRAWTMEFDGWTGVRSGLLLRVTQALDDAGIAIPFNQLEVHVRSPPPA